MGRDLPRSHHDGRRHRPPRPPSSIVLAFYPFFAWPVENDHGKVICRSLCHMAATAPERKPPATIPISMSLPGVRAWGGARPCPRPIWPTRNLLQSLASDTVPLHRRTPKFAAGLPIERVTIGASSKANEFGFPGTALNNFHSTRAILNLQRCEKWLTFVMPFRHILQTIQGSAQVGPFFALGIAAWPAQGTLIGNGVVP
jgi:hypothetical protein